MLERDCQHVTVGVIYSWIADQTRAKVERQRGNDGERHYENNSRPGRVVVLLQFHQKNLFWRIRWAIFVYFKALTSKASWKPQYVPNLSVWQTRRDNGGSSRRRRRRRSSGEKAKRQTNIREGKTEEPDRFVTKLYRWELHWIRQNLMFRYDVLDLGEAYSKFLFHCALCASSNT